MIMMKKTMKKLITIAVSVAMVVCATIAVPTKAEAASVKDIYLVTDTPAEYSMGFWTGSSGIMLDAQMSVDGWTYIFTEVEEGLYKMSVSLSDNYTALGMSVSVDGKETYKADPSWSGSVGAEVWVSFLDVLEGSDEVYIGLDDSNKTITVLPNPNGEPEETEEPKEDSNIETEEVKDPVIETAKDYMSTATDGNYDDTDDGFNILFVIVPAVVVIIVVAIVVVNVALSSKKKSVYDFDDDDE